MSESGHTEGMMFKATQQSFKTISDQPVFRHQNAECFARRGQTGARQRAESRRAGQMQQRNRHVTGNKDEH